MRVYEIPGVPIPLKRHRHTGKRCFDPQKKEKTTFRWQVVEISGGLFPVSSPIKLIVEYHMPIPKSLSKKKFQACIHKPHNKKPDLSNLIKFTEDALNGILWEDDSLITSIEAKKIYSEEPKTVFKIEELTKEIFKEEQCNQS